MKHIWNVILHVICVVWILKEKIIGKLKLLH